MASRAFADLRFLFGDLALFGFAQAGIAERVRARAALFLGQGAQHDAGRLGRGAAPGLALARALRAAVGGLAGARALGRRGSGAGGLGLGLAGRAALHLLDDDRLGAAMAEALAHDALLDAAPLQGQGLGRS